MTSWLQPVIASAAIQMKLSLARPTFRFVAFLQPLFYAVIFFYIYRRPAGGGALEDVVLGAGLTTLWSTVVFSSAGDIERERWYGTLEALVVVPGGLRLAMAGKALGNTLVGLFSMGLTWVYVRVLFGCSLGVADPGLLALGLAATVISLLGFSLALASVFTLSRNARGLMNALEYPVYILSGLVFPLSVLPAWLRPVSYLLPPTWAKLGLRAAALGDGSGAAAWLGGPSAAGGGAPALWYCLGAVLAGLVYLALAWRGFRTIDFRARVSGELGVW